jgi:hypothetical protein
VLAGLKTGIRFWQLEHGAKEANEWRIKILNGVAPRLPGLRRVLPTNKIRPVIEDIVDVT